MNLMLLSAVLVLLAASMAPSAIIPAERRIDWKVGIPGGIPTDRPVWKNVTDLPYSADPTGLKDSSPAFNQALADMPEGRVLYLPAGTYRLDSSLLWQGKGNNKTLRGAGPDSTKLLFYGGMVEMRPASKETELSVHADLSKDGVKGETNVHLSALPSWLKPGHLYIIDQLDDPSFVKTGGSEGSAHPREGTGNGPRGLGQIVKVTTTQQKGPSDYQVSFEIPLYYGFRTSQQAQIAMAGYDANSAAPVAGCGIEDLYLESKQAVGWNRGVAGHLVRMENCLNCWIKNVESYNPPANCHVWASFCYGLEIRDSYFHHSHSYRTGEAFGVALYNDTSASLVENNIFKHLHYPMIACYGASGNVFGYNYAYEGVAASSQAPSISTHGTHSYMNLWEGNQGVKALFDWTHGSGSHNTLFRNRLLGWEPGGVLDQCAVNIEYHNRRCNVVGNILGTLDYHTVYEHANGEPDDPRTDRVIYRLGYSTAGNQPPHDDLATMDLIRHGNYDYVTKSTAWSPTIPDHNLSPSLYLKAKPSWFGNLPWPVFGPDVPGLEGKTPAFVRFWGTVVPPTPVPPAPSASR